MLAHLCDSKFFTSLDLRSTYYHIKLSPGIRHKIAFNHHIWQVQIPQNALWSSTGPMCFTALMQKVLGQFNDLLFPCG